MDLIASADASKGKRSTSSCPAWITNAFASVPCDSFFDVPAPSQDHSQLSLSPPHSGPAKLGELFSSNLDVINLVKGSSIPKEATLSRLRLPCKEA